MEKGVAPFLGARHSCHSAGCANGLSPVSHPAFFRASLMSPVAAPDVWNDVQWMASALGIAGAVTNSLGGRLLRLTWPVWLLSNVLAIAALWRLGAHGFLAQQSFYCVTTLVGGFREFWPRQWATVCRAAHAARTFIVPIRILRPLWMASPNERPLDYPQWLREVDRLAWEHWAQRDYTRNHGANDAENTWAKAYLAGLTPAAAWAGETRPA